MKFKARPQLLAVLILVLLAGCNALPGLRVLSGQEGSDAAAERVVELTDLVMADKSGTTDPSIIAAADRIEAATGNVDIVEIRHDPSADVFTVYLLLQPDANATQEQYVNNLRRAIELTWQGTMNESQGSDVLKVVILSPDLIPTLNQGMSFVGFVALNSEITRSDALAYLSERPHTLNDFIDLVAQGTLAIQQPETQADLEFYNGQPNHPVYMLAALEAQARAQQGQ